jgi:hypothetical protein
VGAGFIAPTVDNDRQKVGGHKKDVPTLPATRRSNDITGWTGRVGAGFIAPTVDNDRRKAGGHKKEVPTLLVETPSKTALPFRFPLV